MSLWHMTRRSKSSKRNVRTPPVFADEQLEAVLRRFALNRKPIVFSLKGPRSQQLPLNRIHAG